MTIAKLALDQAGRVVVIDDQLGTSTGAPFIAAQAYDSTYRALWVDTGAVNAADGFNNGLRFTTAGALRIYDATAVLPATVNTHLGMAMTTDGQVCVTSGASTSPYVLNGVAMTNDGRVYVDILAFALEFADLGAGVVSTVEAIGNATPTFTRATAATTVLSTGLIGAVASGDPRSYYDPTSLTYLGYLAEGARTNLCLQSESLDVDGAGAPWTNTRATVSADATTAPDGAATADKLVEDSTAASSHFITQAETYANAIHTLSVFAKAGERTWTRLVMFDGTTTRSGFFNLSTGAVGTLTNTTGAVTAYPNGWYRLSITSTVALANAAGDFAIYLAEGDNDITFSGDGASGAYFWGVQLEAGAFASTYIPTTTLAVARNADVLTYPTTGWLSATAGTIYAQYLQFIVSTGSTRQVFVIDDGTNNETIRATQIATDGTSESFLVLDGGATSANVTSPAITADTTYRKAAAYTANDFISARNGVLSLNDTSGTLPTVTTASVGGLSAGGGSFNGPIRRVEYYANRMPNAVLQALTNGSR